MPDPRIFFAAERTLLAWVRSGLTVMALGFVVAKFGLVVSLLARAREDPAGLQDTHRLADTLGIALMGIGAFAVLGAWRNYRLFVRSLPPVDVPALGLPWLTSFLALSVGIGGILMALYLALT
jgi:putative membrane protein